MRVFIRNMPKNSFKEQIQNSTLESRPFFLCYESTKSIKILVYNSFTLAMEDHLLEISGGHYSIEVLRVISKVDWNSIKFMEENT